jgi:hypothetical protein
MASRSETFSPGRLSRASRKASAIFYQALVCSAACRQPPRPLLARVLTDQGGKIARNFGYLDRQLQPNLRPGVAKFAKDLTITLEGRSWSGYQAYKISKGSHHKQRGRMSCHPAAASASYSGQLLVGLK